MNRQQKESGTTEFHVRYAETDAMGVVHHASYLVYFGELYLKVTFYLASGFWLCCDIT